MQTYRGIKVLDAVPLTCQDGSTHLKNVQALDKLADRLEQTGYKLKGSYKSTSKKTKARCNNGHDTEFTPNNFVTKTETTHCKTCYLENKHDKPLKEFYREVMLRELTLQEPLNFKNGVLAGLKEHYDFTCNKCGTEHYLSPIGLVKHIHFKCGGCFRKGK